MAYRGGIIAGKWRDGLRAETVGGRTDTDVDSHATLPTHGPVPWRWIAVGVAVLVVVLTFLPGRTRIPPLVDSDYCYLLIAADRLFDGQGLTTPSPVAPLQPWDWQGDWSFLTQWPMGYPLLVCLFRWTLGVATMEACLWISVIACATALVGWFAWVKRCVPPGVAGTLLAAVAAGCSVSTALLLNPSTDVIVVATLPLILLLTTRAVALAGHEDDVRSRRRSLALLAIAGLAAGGLFWIRYAAIFVPLAVGAYLWVEYRRRRREGFESIAVFATSAAAPIGTLVLVNRLFGSGSSLQAQLNLGHAMNVDFSPNQLVTAWRNFTEFGFYNHHWYSEWFFMLWPLGAMAIGLCVRPARRALVSYLRTPGVRLSAITVMALLTVLIGATAVFGDKYDYVGLDRYYLPLKPLYFLLFVAPLLLIPLRGLRAAMCVVLLMGCSWLVFQEWSRPYKRWLAADRAVTPYGQWAQCFGPGASSLYRWLAEQKADDLIVVSNFHEYIALETGIPAVTIPKDQEMLDSWIDRIGATRGVHDPRVLFVLDTQIDWRDYWIKPAEDIVRTFRLAPLPGAPSGVYARVLTAP